MKSVRHLVKSFAPAQYDLSLDLDKHKLKFSGSVVMEGRLKADSTSITVHAKDLKIKSATIDGKSVTIENNAKTDELTLTAKSSIAKGKHEVALSFSGTITKPMTGLYPCFFKYKGKDERILATQFESHHAREVFPCIDEPAAKAVFNLTLTTDTGEVVLADTPIVSQEEIKGRLVTKFESTPIMSSYLLAFVVGKLKSLEATSKGGVLVRTWATPDNVEFTKFALDVAVRCLDFYDGFFKTSYPLPKCDLIALPDFAAGAMENWGCITFRETALLVDPKNTPLDAKQWVGIVVAHELAHQWFGNLVTMTWWTDLWLNEGFASWVEYLAIDNLFPDWKMWTQFVTDDMMRAQVLDGLSNTHPVEVKVEDPDDIRNIFDEISYNKGASLIRMLYAYMGPADFREGLSHYLKTNAYKNAVTKDLWKALETKSAKPVTKFMSAWTSQPGFPVVSVKNTPKSLALTQERFTFNPKVPADKQTWPVPVDSNHAREPFLFTSKQDEWKTKTDLPLKINRGNTGFYIAQYDDELLLALSKAVKAGKLSEIDRLGLLSDQLSLAISGKISTRKVLELLQSYAKEDSAAVWDVIAVVIGSSRRVMDSEPLREAMKPWLRDFTTAQFVRLGWKPKTNESYFDQLLRPTILGLASLGENADVVQTATKMFETATKPDDIQPDVRGIVYGTVIRNGGDKEFTKLLAWYRKTNSAYEKSVLAGALTGFKQQHLIEQALGMIRSDEVKLQDVTSWLGGSFGNHYAKRQAWEWEKTNWDWLVENFGSDIMTFSYLPRFAARVFSTESFLKEYDAFFGSHYTKGIDRSVAQGHEIIEYQAQWRERDADDILGFFSANF